MNKSSEAAFPSPRSRTKKLNLLSPKAQSPNPLHFTSKTPEKPPQRTRNRGVALSVDEIKKVGKRLQDRNQHTVRRQIQLSPSSPSPRNSNITPHESSNLPQKYEMLDEFFNRLDSLILMHRLKGWTPTFTSISSRIESLTDRRFTHSHLAQLKFILPEAIVLKKHLVLDERTSCMKPDIHISLNPSAVEAESDLPPQRERVSLKKLFQTRLKDFLESHPEVDDIPEGTLPEPFNRQKKENMLDMSEARLPSKLSLCTSYIDIVKNAESVNIDEKLSLPVKASFEFPNEHLVEPSHRVSSFKTQFSQKFKQSGVDDVRQKCPLDSLQQPVTSLASESSPNENSSFQDSESHLKTSPAKLISEAASSQNCLTNCASLESSCAPLATPVKIIDNKENKDEPLHGIDVLSTPSKLVSTPIKLMSATPALRSTKRLYMSPDDCPTSSLSKLVRRPPRSRSLKFDTPVKNKEVVKEASLCSLPIDDDIHDILSENLIQSIREKEIMAMEERDPAITQAKKRKKNIASLPKLFDMIRSLLPQRNCMTKAELVSKIISSRCDIIDRSEVEEQLNLLLELAPEWISEKQVSSGDLLVFVNKMLSPGIVRASLEEAL